MIYLSVPRVQTSTKLSNLNQKWSDSNPDFLINPSPDLGVCWIAHNILWITALSVSVISLSVVKIGQRLWEMLMNLL